MGRCVGTEEGSGERRGAGLERVGRRFTRRTNALEDGHGRLRFRLRNPDRGDHRQEKSGERRRFRRFGRRSESQRVVGGPVRLMMIVIVMVAGVVIVMMMTAAGNAGRRAGVMRLDGEMDGDVIDVEREQQRDPETPPAARLVRRAVCIAGSACDHSQRAAMYPRCPCAVHHRNRQGRIRALLCPGKSARGRARSVPNAWQAAFSQQGQDAPNRKVRPRQLLAAAARSSHQSPSLRMRKLRTRRKPGRYSDFDSYFREKCPSERWIRLFLEDYLWSG